MSVQGALPARAYQLHSELPWRVSGRDRTCDLRLFRAALYQLSYKDIEEHLFRDRSKPVRPIIA